MLWLLIPVSFAPALFLAASLPRFLDFQLFGKTISCWCSVGNEGMTPINHPLWFHLGESLGSFAHSLLSTSKTLVVHE